MVQRNAEEPGIGGSIKPCKALESILFILRRQLVSCSDDEDEWEEDDDEDAEGQAMAEADPAEQARAVAAVLGVDKGRRPSKKSTDALADGLAELDMDNYDEEDDQAGEDGEAASRPHSLVRNSPCSIDPREMNVPTFFRTRFAMAMH
jgi:hypothetical protein